MTSSYRDRYVRDGSASCLSVKIDLVVDKGSFYSIKESCSLCLPAWCSGHISPMYLGSELACMDKPLGCYL